MITLLSKIFIKDRKNYQDTKVRYAYGLLCGIVGIVLNVMLFAIKMVAGILGNSIAITADAFNNLSDAGSSVVTLLGFRLATIEPDPEHPFGHGRIEYISGLIVSGIIILMGFELLKDSVDKIIHPQATAFSGLVLFILIISILVKLYMAFYNRRLAEKIDSAAMRATGMDSLSDVAATGIVLLSMIISHFCVVQIDGICGVIVAVIILIAGFSAGKETVSPLLGQPPEPEFVDEIEKIVMAQEGIVGVHDLVVHNYGPGRVMISLHAEVPANMDIMYSHDVIDLTEHKLKQELKCDAVIHMDPVETDNQQVSDLKKKVQQVISEWNEKATIHDFRVVFGNTHSNLIFDVVVPYSVKRSESEITGEIQKCIWEEIGKEYMAVINIDHSYV